MGHMASPLVHQLWRITSGASCLVHYVWCITSGASSLVHHVWCIQATAPQSPSPSGDASATLEAPLPTSFSPLQGVTKSQAAYVILNLRKPQPGEPPPSPPSFPPPPHSRPLVRTALRQVLSSCKTGATLTRISPIWQNHSPRLCSDKDTGPRGVIGVAAGKTKFWGRLCLVHSQPSLI